MRKVFLVLIILFFITFHLFAGISFKLKLNGSSIKWSPLNKYEFIYAIYGKSTGEKIWKMYNLKSEKEETVVTRTLIPPVWSLKQNQIVYGLKNRILIKSQQMEREYEVPISQIAFIDFPVNSENIIYSGEEKIYLLNTENGKNSFIENGENASFMNNDSMIIFLDPDNNLSLLDSSMKKIIIFTNFFYHFLPFKFSDKIIFKYRNNLFLCSVPSIKTNAKIVSTAGISDFNISFDEKYIIYTTEDGKIMIHHIDSGINSLLFQKDGAVTSSLSLNNQFLSIETEKKIFIYEITELERFIGLDRIFKVFFLENISLPPDTEVEIYEEKLNPFTSKITGYDDTALKAKAKIIRSTPGMGIVKIISGNLNEIEKGDAVVLNKKLIGKISEKYR